MKTRTSSLHKPRRRITRWVGMMVSIPVWLLVVEVLLRVFHLGPNVNPEFNKNYRLSDDDALRYELIPGSPYVEGVINSDGMQDREREIDKPEGVFRVACLGDSVTYGLHAHPEGVYPRILETWLNRYFASSERRFEVLNFAVTGYNVTQVVQSLRVKALKYEPDVIIYGYCLNDPQDYSWEFEGLRTQLNPARKNYRERLLHETAGLLSHSRVYLLAKYAWEARGMEKQAQWRRNPDLQWRHFQGGSYGEYFTGLHYNPIPWGRIEKGLDDLAEIAGRLKVPCRLAIFPVFLDLEDYRLGEVHERLARSAEARGLEVIDLLKPYQVYLEHIGPNMNYDELHPNETGHAYAAMVMIHELIGRGALLAGDRSFESIITAGRPESEMAAFVHDLVHDAP